MGFGDSFLSTEDIDYMYGVWSYSEAEESSNYREMNNCITTIQKLGEMGNLQHVMLLFCTGNSTVETPFTKDQATAQNFKS